MAKKKTSASTEGTITLLHHGQPVAQLSYKGTKDKATIISNWKKLYGASKVTDENITTAAVVR
jgi:hypothetical protein